MSLVEAIKKLRARDSVIFSEPVHWPLNESFIGEPITTQTVSKISQFVDSKLIEYVQQNNFKHGSLIPLIKSSPDQTVSCQNDGSLYVPRHKHKVIKLPEPLPQHPGKVAFVTAYDLNYDTMSLKTRVIIAPSTEVIPDSEWFELGESCSVRDQIKEAIKSNLTVLTKTRATPVPVDQKNPEYQALLTLREMITEAEFRKYLKEGFILVRGANNKIYQIFRNKPHTKVYKNGKLIEELCVRIKDKGIPATDNVIAFKAILETSEDQLRSMANVYRMEAA